MAPYKPHFSNLRFFCGKRCCCFLFCFLVKLYSNGIQNNSIIRKGRNSYISESVEYLNILNRRMFRTPRVVLVPVWRLVSQQFTFSALLQCIRYWTIEKKYSNELIYDLYFLIVGQHRKDKRERAGMSKSYVDWLNVAMWELLCKNIPNKAKLIFTGGQPCLLLCLKLAQ